MKSILVPLDGTRNAEAALESIVDYCGPEDEVVLLRVEKPERRQRAGYSPGAAVTGAVGGPAGGGVAGVAPPDLPVYVETGDQVLDRQIQEARDYLEGLGEGLRKKGRTVRTEVLIEDNPDEAIIDYARHLQPKFIVMLRRTHPSLPELIFGSIASSIVRADIAPVLFVPPAGRLAG